MVIIGSIIKKYLKNKFKKYLNICLDLSEKNNFNVLKKYFSFTDIECHKINNLGFIDNKKRKIFDCFIFDGEYELLELRLIEYYKYVDYFIIVEIAKTHTGFANSNSNFEKNENIWSKYKHKIIYKYVEIDEIPNFSNEEKNNIENFHRNYINNILYNYATIGDIILISDCDEFWSIDNIEKLKNNKIVFFIQDIYYYYFNCKKNQLWCGTISYPFGTFTPQEARNLSIKINNFIFGKNINEIIDFSNKLMNANIKILVNAGSHFSWLKNNYNLNNKYLSVYESDLIKHHFSDLKEIERKMENGEDILNRNNEVFNSIFIKEKSLCNVPRNINYIIKKYPYLYKKMENHNIEKSVEIICLIYKSIRLLKMVYSEMLNIKKNNKEWKIGIRFIANDASEEVKKYLSENNIPHSIFKNKSKKEYYINRIYKAYNFGVLTSNYANVILINSDMIFDEKWFKNLVKHHDGINIPCSRLVEYGNLSTSSYGLLGNCGNFIDTEIDEKKLKYIVEKISRNETRYCGLYMPCIFETKKFIESGGYPCGNINHKLKITNKTKDLYKTGDRYFFENILRDKYKMNHITVFDSIVYHFQEGEKRSE